MAVMMAGWGRESMSDTSSNYLTISSAVGVDSVESRTVLRQRGLLPVPTLLIPGASRLALPTTAAALSLLLARKHTLEFD